MGKWGHVEHDWDELRQVEAVERHFRATGSNCDEWSWIETRLKRVWINFRHALTSQVWLGQISLRLGWLRDELRWMRSNLSDVGASKWRQRRVIRVTIAKCNDLLWVRNIYYTVEKFQDTWVTSWDSLNWFVDEWRRIGDVWHGLKRSCARSTMSSRQTESLQGKKKHLQKFNTITKSDD